MTYRQVLERTAHKNLKPKNS